MNKPSICVLTDAWTPVWGGGQEHILQIYERLVKKGYPVDVVAPQLIGGKENATGFNVKRIGPEFRFPNLIGRVAFLIYLSIFLMFSNYDWYHSHSPGTTFCLLFVKLRGKKVSMTIHGKGTDLIGSNWLTPVGRFVNYLLTYIVVYDRLYTAARSSLKYKVRTAKVIVTGNGVNIENFDKVSVKKKKSIQLLFVGRDDPVKGKKYLIQAFKQLVKKYPTLKLNLVGPPHNELKGRALIKAYKQSHLYILPSLSEGFPLVVVEAMAAYLPIIATRVGDVPNIITKSEAGLLIEPGSAEEIVNAVEKMIKHKSTWSQIGKNNHDFVAKNYSWDKIAKLYES